MSIRMAAAGVAAVLAAALIPHMAAKAQPPPPAAEAPENAPAATTAPDDDTNLPIPPVPPRIAEGAPYEACLDMLATDPSGADAMAGTVPGEAGAHCHALAQVELGNSEEGATLLDTLAAASTAPAASRAVVFAQAGQAWTMAGRTDQALASASQALALSPDDPDLRIGHAVAALARQKFADAADDLSHALELDPKRADALVLRATARRNLGLLEPARADIEAALGLDPENADGLLERGIIRQRIGDLKGARTDWQKAAELAPDTPTGDLAQQNLALLEAGPAR